MDPVIFPVAVGGYVLYRWCSNALERKRQEQWARIRATDLATWRKRCVIWVEGGVTHNLWVSASSDMPENLWQDVLAVLPKIGEVREHDIGDLPHFEKDENKHRRMLWIDHCMFRSDETEASRASVRDWVKPKKFIKQYRK